MAEELEEIRGRSGRRDVVLGLGQALDTVVSGVVRQVFQPVDGLGEMLRRLAMLILSAVAHAGREQRQGLG